MTNHEVENYYEVEIKNKMKSKIIIYYIYSESCEVNAVLEYVQSDSA